jgi:energy-coupling factor transporter ATP-binding protein EcfA2
MANAWGRRLSLLPDGRSLGAEPETGSSRKGVVMRDAKRWDATTDQGTTRKIWSLTELFGASRGDSQPRAYLDRPAIDARFKRALRDGTHIAVFGTPGVGKSTLIQRHAGVLPLLFVQCLKAQDLPDLYRSMLSEAGARVRTETRLSKKRRLRATLKLVSGESERGTESTETEVTLDLGNVGDVFRTLTRQTDKNIIVLNDFHVLPRRTQRRLMRNLQYVSERTAFRFVVIGNWYTPAYLTDLNELVPSFMTDVKVTAWSDDELCALLEVVERLLNIAFSTAVKEAIVNMSAGSARELTEICRLLLIDAGVESSESTTREISETDALETIMATRVGPLFRRYRELLTSYLTVKLLTAEGTEVDDFLLTTVDHHIMRDVAHEAEEPADDDDDDDEEEEEEDEKEQYSFDELRAALDLVVRNKNQPREDGQRRRRILVEQLAAGARRDGSEVSVPLKSILDPDVLDVETEEAAYRKECRALVRGQRRNRFYPALAAYDPRARALVALEPRFRAFLRTDAGDISKLQQSIQVPVDQYFVSHRTYEFQDEIVNAARLNRWRTQHPSQ